MLRDTLTSKDLRLPALAIMLVSGTIARPCTWYGQLRGGEQMIHSLMMLAVEANSVVALRMMKLMLGGTEARREAELMVREKIRAGLEATANLMAGASGDEIVHRYRQHVAANAKRLGRLNSGRRRHRVLKRTRTRRKWR